MRKLIYLGGSPFARKVRIVLAELGLAHEAVQHPRFHRRMTWRRSIPT